MCVLFFCVGFFWGGAAGKVFKKDQTQLLTESLLQVDQAY